MDVSVSIVRVRVGFEPPNLTTCLVALSETIPATVITLTGNTIQIQG